MIEREITEPVPLTGSDGGLNPQALGWTRTPLHDTSGIGRGHWGRNKRWEYWGVMTLTHILATTVSDIDYLSLHSVWLLDRASGEVIDVTALSPGSGSATLPGSTGQGPARVRAKAITIDVEELADGSGTTENAVVVDGRLSKISEELVWDYDMADLAREWRITAETADLRFTPFHHRHARTQALVIATRADQMFGTWSGWVRDDAGERVKVDGIEGWAEDVLNRW